jgi:hypothetical protein
MRRFLMVLAVAVLAGAVYVAASPGAQQAGPTAKQFKALEKKVAKLQKQVKTVQTDANDVAAFVLVCVMKQPVGVDSLGTSTDGYLFGPPQTAPNPVTATATSALGVAASGTTPQYQMYVVNTSNPGCVNAVSSAATLSAVRHVAAFGH